MTVLLSSAAAVLMRNGYPDTFILKGGVDAWIAAGFEVFSGVNVPSKAFGEYIEHKNGTPNISAHELEKLIRDKANIVVLDSRPFDEYSRVSIPTGINVPGAELVLRAREIAPAPETTVVVNCAGRTRSIIGAQSLINAGLPNKVVALRNGTMGYSLAGFACDSGKNRRAPKVSSKTLDWARQAAQKVAQDCGVEQIDRVRLEALRQDQQRTLYLFDVRDPGEYAAGHVSGAISAPGGQLVQATDQYVGTLGARIVLVDDAEVRAAMTGSWLRQMGFGRRSSCWSSPELKPAGRKAPTLDGERKSRRSHRCRLVERAAVARCGDRRRSCNEPRLSRRTYSRRMVCHPHPARPGAQENSVARHTGADFGRRRSGKPRGGGSESADRRSRCASSLAAMPRGRRPAIRYPRMPRWPTKRSINGASRMSGPAIPKLR
jgi:rhodanese-related sulfurtransferase